MKKLSIKIQILLLSALSLTLIAAIATYISTIKSKEALLGNSYANLTTIRDMKKIRLRGYLEIQSKI